MASGSGPKARTRRVTARDCHYILLSVICIYTGLTYSPFTYQAHKPITYEYDQRKKKRPPPGAGDFLKDGGTRRPPGDPCPRADLLRGAGGARGATWTAPQQQPRFHVAAGALPVGDARRRFQEVVRRS